MMFLQLIMFKFCYQFNYCVTLNITNEKKISNYIYVNFKVKLEHMYIKLRNVGRNEVN